MKPIPVSFKDYLFKNRKNRTILWISGLLIIFQFVVFKYLYPDAGFIHGDSFNYLHSATQNLDINTYMIGYAKYMRLVSAFTSSDFALVTLQYLQIEAAGLFLVFTIFYFYEPGRVVRWILLAFMVVNPLYLYMANYVSSDALFLALSLTWFTLLLWLIQRPSRRLVVWHAILLFLAFTVRYNALIYPIITLVAFGLSPLPLRQKISGITLGFLLVGGFVIFTSAKYKALTGVWQYSPFSGWQMTNNAMYTYRYVDNAEKKPVPPRFKALDNAIRAYFDTTRDLKTHPVENLQASTVYMWDSRISPLYKYRDSLYKNKPNVGELQRWSSMGPLYKDYGTYIIRQYPWRFLRYFIWPNAQKYYAPPVEFLATYNSGKDSTALVAQQWFKYASRKLFTRMKDKKVYVLNFYPILSGITNAVMVFILLFFIILRGEGSPPLFRKAIALGGALWLVNAGFTIFASSAALRFQAFPIVLAFIMLLLLVDWLYAAAFRPKITLSREVEKVAQNQPNEVLG